MNDGISQTVYCVIAGNDFGKFILVCML